MFGPTYECCMREISLKKATLKNLNSERARIHIIITYFHLTYNLSFSEEDVDLGLDVDDADEYIGEEDDWKALNDSMDATLCVDDKTTMRYFNDFQRFYTERGGVDLANIEWDKFDTIYLLPELSATGCCRAWGRGRTGFAGRARS